MTLFNDNTISNFQRTLIFFCTSALAIITFAHPAFANEELNWKGFNLAIVKDQIIPSYENLANTSLALVKASQMLCQKTSQSSLDAAKSQFHQTMDAWQGIQHIHFGPIEYVSRAASLQFWPDKKNHIGKQLSRALTNKDENLLGDDFVKSSVALKGLPAIERLLFSKTALSELKQDPYRCQLLVRISQNVNDIGQALANEWQNEMLPQFQDASQVDGYFEDDIDAATALLKTIVEPLEIIHDLKLKRPMASKKDLAKPKRLESWRSERSLRNIQLNIQASAAAFSMLDMAIDDTSLQATTRQFEELLRRLSMIEKPIEYQLQEANTYAALSKLKEKLKDLHSNLESVIAKQGIHLGFNSRDGD